MQSLLHSIRRVLWEKGRARWFFGCLAVGTVLRFVYFLVTPHDVRGYDTNGHIEYIQHLSTHFSLPHSLQGWEFHQPPLYYFLCSLWMRVGHLFSFSEVHILRDLQFFSFLLSVVALAAALWIGKMLWGKKEESEQLLLYWLLVATAPSLVFHASRISNDALSLTLLILLTAFVIRWWKDPSTRNWYGMCLVFGCSLLAKANALSFVPVLFILWCALKQWNWRQKCARAVIGAVIVMMIAGWVPAYRYVKENNTDILLNISQKRLNHHLGVRNTLSNFLIFNPVQIVLHPFNDPWRDEDRRQYFWEYLFKSAFFGEFKYPNAYRMLATSVLVSGMIGLILAAIGLVHETRKRLRANAPMLLILVCPLAALLAYRLWLPYSANQDFRFSAAIIIPLSYFAVQGAFLLTKRKGIYAKELLLALAVFSALFLLSLGF